MPTAHAQVNLTATTEILHSQLCHLKLTFAHMQLQCNTRALPDIFKALVARAAEYVRSASQAQIRIDLVCFAYFAESSRSIWGSEVDRQIGGFQLCRHRSVAHLSARLSFHGGTPGPLHLRLVFFYVQDTQWLESYAYSPLLNVSTYPRGSCPLSLPPCKSSQGKRYHLFRIFS